MCQVNWLCITCYWILAERSIGKLFWICWCKTKTPRKLVLMIPTCFNIMATLHLLVRNQSFRITYQDLTNASRETLDFFLRIFLKTYTIIQTVSKKNRFHKNQNKYTLLIQVFCQYQHNYKKCRLHNDQHS